MGRNDVCFCGSGKKTKKCHPDINEDSIVAGLLSLYNELDMIINNHFGNTGYEYPCREGCSKCCYDYFPISDIEFDMITIELRNWSKAEMEELARKTVLYWNRLAETNPEYVSILEEDITGKENWEMMRDMRYSFGGKDYPCLFLDDDTQKCKVYNSRPFMCRSYGLTYQPFKDSNLSEKAKNYYDSQNVCEVIGNYKEAQKWQADISSLYSKIVALSKIESPRYDFEINKRPYPIIYWLYIMFVKFKTGTEIPDYEGKFMISREQYIEKSYKKVVPGSGYR